MSHTIPPPSWCPTNADYHHGPGSHAVSSSRLKVFRRSPQEYHGLYVAKTLEASAPTPAMVVGTVVNTLLLEPERGDTGWVWPCSCETRAAKEYKDAVIARPHQVVCTAREWEEGKAIAAAILEPRTEAARLARSLLIDSEGYSEYAHRWKDAETGLECRLKLDRLRLIGGRPTIAELKTTTDPEPRAFAAQVDRMGYDAQAAFYVRGLTPHLGEEPAYIWVAVRNGEPYEVATPRQISPGFLALGRQKIEKDMRELAACLAGARPWVADWQSVGDVLPTLEPPAWRRRDEAFEAE